MIFDPAAEYGNNLQAALAHTRARLFRGQLQQRLAFFPQRSHELVKALIAAQKPVQYIEVESHHGHDAFLMEDAP